jgi:hypothetical protein
MRRKVRIIGGVALLFFVVLFALWYGKRSRPPRVAPPPAADAGVKPAAPARPATRAPVRLLRAQIAQDPAATGGSFAGRVVSATRGVPVPGAELSFVRGGVATSVLAGKDGSFAFTPKEPGTYTLATVTAAGFLPFAPELGQSPITAVLLPGVRIHDVVIALTPAVDYVGVVLDPEGRPVAGARVRIVGPGVDAATADGAPLAPLPDRFTSDARGEFRFHAPDGTLLEAQHEGYTPARALLDFAAQVSHRLVLRLGPAAPARQLLVIGGRVIAADGTPAAGVIVTAEARPAPLAPGAGAGAGTGPGGNGPPPAPPGRARTGADGHFLIEGLEAGRHDLTATQRTVAVAWARDVAAGSRDVILRLAAAGRLTGRVSERNGAQPVPAFTVVVVRRLGPLERETAAVRAFFDSRGTYAIDDLAAGDYDVTVAAHGFAVPERKPVTIAAGAGAVTDFELGRGARLSGTVIDGVSKKPLEGAAVSLEGQAGLTGSIPLATRATTDAAGRFVLEGLPPGRCSLFVAASDHHARIVGPLTVAGETELPPVTVDLTPVREGETPSIELVGIGAVLKAEGDGLTIQDAIAGGGAAAAGLKAGDVILAVEGQAATTLGFDGAIQLIRGPEGTSVRLLVRRQGGAPEELLVPRRRIRR